MNKLVRSHSIVAKLAPLFLFTGVFLTGVVASPENAYAGHRTNKKEVRQSLEKDWSVVYSKEFSHAEYVKLAAAIAGDVVGGSGSITSAYFSSFVYDSLQKIRDEMSQKAPGAASQVARELTPDRLLSAIKASFNGKEIELSIAGMRLQLGRATYNRAECTETYIAGVRCVKMPNTYQPYIRFKLTANSPSQPSPNSRQKLRSGGTISTDFDGDYQVDRYEKTDDGRLLIDYAKNGFGTWDESHNDYGGPGARPVPADYDGDGKADFSVKLDSGEWLIDYAKNGFGKWDETQRDYGGSGAHPVPGDYDGDGKADLSVKLDSGEWLIDYAKNGFGRWDETHREYGGIAARPVPADYDEDGKADLSVKLDSGQQLIDYARNGFGKWDETR